ncbi:MAG: GntR family transcriptional regulator [Spirochaetales bacterium]|nr:GntR family transcriptional regulator [Spirochaetales bacterium]
MNNDDHHTLEFTLDPKSGVPFYKQIILQIEMAIADGRLVCGDQLPTVRGLAVDLQINPNTVARAYSELEIRGIITSQQGSGSFISDKKIELSEIEREKILAELTRTFITKAASYGFSLEEILHYLQDFAKVVSEEEGEGV